MVLGAKVGFVRAASKLRMRNCDRRIDRGQCAAAISHISKYAGPPVG